MKTRDELPECPVATAVSLIGGKWKLLILRNLKVRPWRFNELRRDLDGISQKVLTDNGVAPYDSKEMNDALGFIKGLVDDGSIHPDTINISAPEARELFAQGQAAFLCK